MRNTCVDCGGRIGYYHDNHKRRCHSCAVAHSKRLNKPPLPMQAGCAMLKGPGERRDDCQHYSACLLDWANRSNADAHCAAKCQFYSPQKQTLEVYGGVDWSSYPRWAGE